jgi:hypothetical protein
VSLPDEQRFDWVEVSDLAGRAWFVRGRCHHIEPVPVTSVLDPGHEVAVLCPDCDAQLPAGWRPSAPNAQ